MIVSGVFVSGVNVVEPVRKVGRNRGLMDQVAFAEHNTSFNLTFVLSDNNIDNDIDIVSAVVESLDVGPVLTLRQKSTHRVLNC